MKSFSILWSPTAISHFSNWIRYIAKDTPKTAEKERLAILKAIERLRNFSESGRIVPEFSNPSLRELIHKPIRIIYRLQANKIRLLTFHHSKKILDRDLFL